MNKKMFVFLMIGVFLIIGAQAHAVTTHTMKSGDTLWELAAKHYGDPTLYPVLLEVNGIDNPRTIANGKVIIIPNKSDMQKIANEKDPAKKKELISNATGSGSGSSNNTVSGNANNGASLSADAASRGGEVDPDEATFINILKGPKVAPEKIIHMDEPK